MNNPSPLMPQGSLLEQKNKGRARVKIAVFFVLAVHGIGLLALLMQGCRQTDTKTTNEGTNATSSATLEAPTNIVPDNAVTTAPTNVIPSAPVEPPPAAATEYTIAKGDTFSSIGKKFHVTVAAITAANPGIDPAKLKIGQKIHVPPPAP